MTTRNGVTIRHIGSNEAYDFWKITGNGYYETYKSLRGSGETEEMILSLYAD